MILGFLDRFVESKQGCISHEFTGKDSAKVSIFAVEGGVMMSRSIIPLKMENSRWETWNVPWRHWRLSWHRSSQISWLVWIWIAACSSVEAWKNQWDGNDEAYWTNNTSGTTIQNCFWIIRPGVYKWLYITVGRFPYTIGLLVDSTKIFINEALIWMHTHANGNADLVVVSLTVAYKFSNHIYDFLVKWEMRMY